MKGIYPKKYFTNPNVDKPIEQIWDDIESYSGEFFEDEVNYHQKIDFVIPIPPLDYNGKITKGVVFSQGMGYLLKLYPDLKKIFHCAAYTMWSNYSWCDEADVYLCCYENKARQQYHINKYQRKKDIIFIPLQDADFTNEYAVAPTFYQPKTIDILSVATALEVKNLPLVAKTIIEYEKKYKKIPKTTFIFGSNLMVKNPDGTIDCSKEKSTVQNQYKITQEILHDYKDYVEFIPFVKYKEIPKYYSSAKCTVLASLIEGKNRSINESMSCDTPVVLFKQHNQWARGGYPIFFGNSGELADEFSATSLADTIHKVLTHPQDYEPRKNYLKYNGRKNFVNKLTEYIPYYRENIPDFKQGYFHENIWVDLACQKNYQIGYHDFLYGKNPAICHVRGLENINSLIKFFYSRFHIK